MPLIKISQRTWAQVKAEDRQRRIELGREFRRQKDEERKSLREIAAEQHMSHQQVANLIAAAIADEMIK